MIVMGALRGMDVGGVCVGKKKKASGWACKELIKRLEIN